MKRTINNAFTFVELIVVITIMAILATIGFMVYKDYLASSYDSNRIAQLSDIHDGLELLSVSSKLPFPENMLELTASGATFAYQGDVGDTVIKAIGYDGGGKDPEYNIPFVYLLSKGGKDFQLMTFVKDPNLLSYSEAYAEPMNYQEYFPILKGAPLGILLNKQQKQPIHVGSKQAAYDIVTGTGQVLSYLSNKKILDSSKDDMTLMLPKKSCKRILDLGNSNGSGEYVISPLGNEQILVYCDMETSGGGWTFAAQIGAKSPSSNISFNQKKGQYSHKRSTQRNLGYSIKMDDLQHTEMMITLDSPNPSVANAAGKLLMLKYDIGTPGFYTGPLGCDGFNGDADFFFHKTYLENEYIPNRNGYCGVDQWTIRPTPFNYPSISDGGVSDDNKTLLHLSDRVKLDGTPKGPRWWPTAWGLNGNPSWEHPAWFYVR